MTNCLLVAKVFSFASIYSFFFSWSSNHWAHVPSTCSATEHSAFWEKLSVIRLALRCGVTLHYIFIEKAGLGMVLHAWDLSVGRVRRVAILSSSPD